MILIVSNARDITTDFIVLELQRRGLAYLRLNSEALPQATVSFGTSGDHDWSIRIGERLIHGRQVTAGYFRRPGTPEPDPAVTDHAERRYCATEWSAALKSLYLRLGAKWLNAPAAIALAEDKPRQLVLARRLGFEVPDTLVTNDPTALKAFLATHGGVVAKPLRHALLDGEVEKVIFTTRMEAAKAQDVRAIAASPVILQAEVPKRVDLRVTVIGEKVFAAAIHSQATADAEVDWRRGDGPSLRHEAVDLPADITVRCMELVRALGLTFGAIDLVEDLNGRYWFLEVNPNGQWAWIETRTGQPIAAALVDTLEAKATA